MGRMERDDYDLSMNMDWQKMMQDLNMELQKKLGPQLTFLGMAINHPAQSFSFTVAIYRNMN